MSFRMILEKGKQTCDSKPKPLVSLMKMITHKASNNWKKFKHDCKIKKIIEYIQTWLLVPIFLAIHYINYHMEVNRGYCSDKLHMLQFMAVWSCKSYISLSSTMSKCGLSSIQTIQY